MKRFIFYCVLATLGLILIGFSMLTGAFSDFSSTLITFSASIIGLIIGAFFFLYGIIRGAIESRK
ncbi:MAG: hypothetical protein ACOCWI_03090 [Bacillota bacterium]